MTNGRWRSAAGRHDSDRRAGCSAFADWRGRDHQMRHQDASIRHAAPHPGCG